jgi:hypothetical protein
MADRSVPEIVQLINGYKKLLLNAQPIDGDDANYKSIVVVFTDLSADRAKGLFDATSYNSLQFHPMWKMDWCWEGSMKATRGQLCGCASCALVHRTKTNAS